MSTTYASQEFQPAPKTDNSLWTLCTVDLPKKNGFYDCTLEGVAQVRAVGFNPQQGLGLKDWPQGSSVLAWKEWTPPYQPEVEAEEEEEEGDE